jgi:uncharacterized protein YdaU (DUF1376 family)
LAEFPALPLFTDAYLADTSHLSDKEHGRYLLILIHLWRAPQQRFPNDDQWLARKFNRPVERVISELRPLIVEFCRTDGNWIWQPRLSDVFEHVQKTRSKNSESAKRRWRNEKEASKGNASNPIQLSKKERGSGGKKPVVSDGFKALMSATLPTKGSA